MQLQLVTPTRLNSNITEKASRFEPKNRGLQANECSVSIDSTYFSIKIVSQIARKINHFMALE